MSVRSSPNLTIADVTEESGILKYQSVHPEWAFWALLALGSIEFALGQLPITRIRRTAFVMLSTIGATLVAAAFPFR